MNTRRLTGLIGALIVVAGIAGLLALLRRSPAPVAAPAGTTSIADELRWGQRDQARTAGSRSPVGGGLHGSDAGPQRRERQDGGIARPPWKRSLTSTTVVALRREMLGPVKECGAALRAREPDVRGQLQVRASVTVEGLTLRVNTLDLSVRGPRDSLYTDCVRSALEGRQLSVPTGQDDVVDAAIAMQFPLP
jgi:hypothetical protein